MQIPSIKTPAYTLCLLMVMPLVLSSMSVSAAGLDEPVIVEGGSSTGPGWVAVRMTSHDGGPMEIEVGALGGAGYDQTAIILFDEDDQLVFGFTITGTGGDDRVTVDVENPAGEDVSKDILITDWERGEGGNIIRITFNPPGMADPQPRSVRAVGYTAGDLTGWRWHVKGAEDVTVDAVNEGDHTFLVGAHQFEGGVRARAVQVPVSASVVASAHHRLKIEHALVGGFRSGPASADIMSMTDPDNETRSCTCTFTDASPAAGSYRFDVTASLGAGLKGMDVANLGGADALLPP